MLVFHSLQKHGIYSNSVRKDYIGKGFNVGVGYSAKSDRLGFGVILREQELMNILPGVVAD